jgi:hypothetical protein
MAELTSGILILTTNTISILAATGILFAFIISNELRNKHEFIYIICISSADLIFSVNMIVDVILMLNSYPITGNFC